MRRASAERNFYTAHNLTVSSLLNVSDGVGNSVESGPSFTCSQHRDASIMNGDKHGNKKKACFFLVDQVAVNQLIISSPGAFLYFLLTAALLTAFGCCGDPTVW